MKLGAGQTTNVVATVKASKKALPGDYVTKMTVKTPEVNATTDFRISVKTPMIWGWVGVLIIVWYWEASIICSANMEGGKPWVNQLLNLPD